MNSKMFYTVDEVSSLTSICVTHIYNEIKEGRLQKIKFGRRTLISAEALENWTKQLQSAGKV